MKDQPPSLAIEIPPGALEEIAENVLALLLPRLRNHATRSPYVSVAEAADYLRTSRQRIYDLLSSGRLTRFRDGSRILLSLEEIDLYLAGAPRSSIAPRLPHASQNRSRSGLPT
jgi:excisionase family DNA binding protein